HTQARSWGPSPIPYICWIETIPSANYLPLPLKSLASSLAWTRSTWTAGCALSSGRSTLVPARSGASRKNRGMLGDEAPEPVPEEPHQQRHGQEQEREQQQEGERVDEREPQAQRHDRVFGERGGPVGERFWRKIKRRAGA